MLFLLVQHCLQFACFQTRAVECVVLCVQRFADPVLARLLCFKLSQPAPSSAFTKLHVPAYLIDAQALRFDARYHWQLEVGIEDSSRFKKLTSCAISVLTTYGGAFFYWTTSVR